MQGPVGWLAGWLGGWPNWGLLYFSRIFFSFLFGCFFQFQLQFYLCRLDIPLVFDVQISLPSNVYPFAVDMVTGMCKYTVFDISAFRSHSNPSKPFSKATVPGNAEVAFSGAVWKLENMNIFERNHPPKKSLNHFEIFETNQTSAFLRHQSINLSSVWG